MLQKLIDSFRRKVARRVTKEYSTEISAFNLGGIGEVKFANWQNPLVDRKAIEPGTLDFFRMFLKEGDMAIDIGANIGHMALTLGLITGKNGITLAFDPNPYVFKILLENSKLNPQLARIEPYNYAITDKDDDFYYNSSEASFNNGGISKEKDNSHGKYALSTKIKGINLEDFLLKNYPEAVKKIKLIKIDTEGYDKEIIRSIGGLLTSYHPTVISECFGKTSREERFDHFNLLKSRGYSIYHYPEFDVHAKAEPIEKKEDMLKWKHFDLIATMNTTVKAG